MRLGFTGTRAGMFPAQKEAVAQLLRDMRPEKAHHGDCVGADEEFHALALDAGSLVVIHPPLDDSRRAFCKGAAVTMPARTFLVRNREIVRFADRLVATPWESEEPEPGRGQGTWSTIRYARKVKVPVLIVWSNGEVTHEVA